MCEWVGGQRLNGCGLRPIKGGWVGYHRASCFGDGDVRFVHVGSLLLRFDFPVSLCLCVWVFVVFLGWVLLVTTSELFEFGIYDMICPCVSEVGRVFFVTFYSVFFCWSVCRLDLDLFWFLVVFVCFWGFYSGSLVFCASKCRLSAKAV